MWTGTVTCLNQKEKLPQSPQVSIHVSLLITNKTAASNPIAVTMTTILLLLLNNSTCSFHRHNQWIQLKSYHYNHNNKIQYSYQDIDESSVIVYGKHKNAHHNWSITVWLIQKHSHRSHLLLFHYSLNIILPSNHQSGIVLRPASRFIICMCRRENIRSITQSYHTYHDFSVKQIALPENKNHTLNYPPKVLSPYFKLSWVQLFAMDKHQLLCKLSGNHWWTYGMHDMMVWS